MTASGEPYVERIRPEEDLEAEKEAQKAIERAVAAICEGGPKGTAEAALQYYCTYKIEVSDPVMSSN